MDVTKVEQITLDDALAFQASADVLEIYIQEFWATASVHNRSIRFKMNNKKHIVNLEYFREMLQICPVIRNQKFEEPPFEQEILTFLVSLGHSGEIRKITDVNVNKLHQPWRSFAVVINKCLSGKSSYDSLRLSQAQIIWGMYHKKNVDYAFLLWEDFTYQVENKNTKKGNVMYYPRFTKLIFNFFMSKDSSIIWRNKINWHYVRDDPMFTTINVISRHEDTQLYGAILPKELINEDIQNSKSYKEYYAIASREVPPKTKATVHKKKADSDTTPKEKPLTDPKDKRVKQTGKMTGSGKQKQPATASGSSDGVDILSKVPDEQVHKKTSTDEGADDKPEVPDVPEHHSNNYQTTDESEKQKDDDKVKDGKEDKEGGVTNVNLEGGDVEMTDTNTTKDTKDAHPQRLQLPLQQSLHLFFLSFNQVNKHDTTEDTKDAHVTLTAATPVVQQQSSSVSDLVSKFISPTTDEDEGSSRCGYSAQIKQAQAENQEFLNSLDSNMQKLIKDQVKTQTSKIKSKVEKYVTESLGAEVLIRSTNQPQTSYGIASSLSELELKRILMDKMEENKSIDRSDVQKNLYNALVEAYNTDKDLLSSYGDVLIIPRTRDDKDKDEEPSAGSNRGTKRRRSGKEAESSKEPTRKESRTTSSSKGASRSQPTDLNETTHLEFITGDDDVIPAREVQDERQWHPPTSPTPDREWHLTKTVSDLPPQHWITDLAQAAGKQSSFDEFMATPIDFSAFMINRLKIDHLTQELLTGPTYDLIKGTCKSVAELDYHLEEVFKATNEQLDWNNPEGTPYPHNLSKPLPLIPNAQGRLVIPFDHFINNDLEYLKGGSSSRKYTTSITKTKAADYGQVKWIKDRIPRTTWSVVPIDYDKHAYWGTYHWGPKRQRFYGYATNMETSKDVYSRHRIIAVISLKIMKFFGYSHLEEITVRRQDDVLYKF
ncbi:hypothetical protein Tco_1507466 [Tanacetum coccineum]